MTKMAREGIECFPAGTEACTAGREDRIRGLPQKWQPPLFQLFLKIVDWYAVQNIL